MRPMMFLDFDGVINAFPDDKIMRRGGIDHTQWLKHGDPRKTLYDPTRAFHLDGNKQVRVGEGRWRIHWSSELTDRLITLSDRADLYWLSTWQPYLDSVIDSLFDWDANRITTVTWYDPANGRRPNGGKLAVILRAARLEQRPIFWVDDEECDWNAQTILEGEQFAQPILMVQPDERIGISRRQCKLIEQFATTPGRFEGVTYDHEPGLETHSTHHGF